MRMDTSKLEQGLEKISERADSAVRVFAEQGAIKMRSSAQRNAKWTDRTGSARQRLNAYVSAMENGYRITLAHGVDYGIWLELAHEKRFSIIPQTINYVGNFDIMPAFERFLERVGR